jgi:hypothetical protein
MLARPLEGPREAARTRICYVNTTSLGSNTYPLFQIVRHFNHTHMLLKKRVRKLQMFIGIISMVLVT